MAERHPAPSIPDGAPIEPGFFGDLGQRCALLVQRPDAIEPQLRSAAAPRPDKVTMLRHLRWPITVDEPGRFLKTHDLLLLELDLSAWGPGELLFDRVSKIL